MPCGGCVRAGADGGGTWPPECRGGGAPPPRQPNTQRSPWPRLLHGAASQRRGGCGAGRAGLSLIGGGAARGGESANWRRRRARLGRSHTGGAANAASGGHPWRHPLACWCARGESEAALPLVLLPESLATAFFTLFMALLCFVRRRMRARGPADVCRQRMGMASMAARLLLLAAHAELAATMRPTSQLPWSAVAVAVLSEHETISKHGNMEIAG